MVECSTESTYFDDTGDLECARLVGHPRSRCWPMNQWRHINKSSELSKLSCMCDPQFMNRNDGSPQAVSELDPRAGCDHLSPRAIAFTIFTWLNIISTLFGSAYAISTLLMIRRRMTLSNNQAAQWQQRWCWWIRNKMAFVATSCAAANVAQLVFVWFYGWMMILMRSAYPWYPAAWRHTILPTVLFGVIALTSISLQWVQIASKAKSFRRHTSRAAQRRAWIFVFSIVFFTLAQISVSLFVLNSASICIGLLLVTVLVIASTYLIGASKLIAIMEAATTTGSTNTGSTHSVAPATKSSSSTMVTVRETLSVSGSRRTGQRLAKYGKKVHLIWVTARRLFAVAMVFAIGVVLSVISLVLYSSNDGEYVVSGRQLWGYWVMNTVADLLWIGSLSISYHIIIRYLRQGIGRRDPGQRTASVVPTSGGDDCSEGSASSRGTSSRGNDD